MTPDSGWKLYRFGPYELDTRNRELRKHGARVGLQEQPLKLLEALLAKPGLLITREELHARLWPQDTFVDFDHGLNTAAARLRQALTDSAKRPRFIESVPRRGYRFIGSLEVIEIGAPGSPAPAREAGELPGSELPPATPDKADVGDRRPSQGKRWLPVMAVAVLSAIGLAGWLIGRKAPAVGGGSYTFSLLPPETTKFVDFDPAAISPDGRSMVFPVVEASGDTYLWLRSLNDLQARRIEGTKGGSFPFWSPDSRSVGFFANGRLKRLDLTGGLPKVLCVAAEGRGGSWSRDDFIVFAPSIGSPLMLVPGAGGEPKPVTTLDGARRHFSHRWPDFLPDGRHFVFTVRAEKREDSGVFVGSVAGDPQTLLVPILSNAVYIHHARNGGLLLYAQGMTIVGRAFDADRSKFTGPEFPIAESRNRINMEPLRADFAASNAGVLAYTPGRSTDTLTWFDRSGARLDTFGEPGIHLDLTLSRDDKEIAFSRRDPNTVRFDVWRHDRSKGAMSRVTYGAFDQVGPVWSPDGSSLFYSSVDLIFSLRTPVSRSEIYQASLKQGNVSKLLLKSDYLKISWSTNGRFLLYHELRPGKKVETWALPLQSEGKPIPLLRGDSNQMFAMFSPDGNWVAYMSDETGKPEIYVVPFHPGGGGTSKWMVSSDGGSQPIWQADGKYLYYLAPDKRIMAVTVSLGNGRFSAGVPHSLFQPDIIDDFRARFAVTADGQRFLVPCSTDQTRSRPETVVVNWSPPGNN